jgi:hypothetical protein
MGSQLEALKEHSTYNPTTHLYSTVKHKLSDRKIIWHQKKEDIKFIHPLTMGPLLDLPPFNPSSTTTCGQLKNADNKRDTP